MKKHTLPLLASPCWWPLGGARWGRGAGVTTCRQKEPPPGPLLSCGHLPEQVFSRITQGIREPSLEHLQCRVVEGGQLPVHEDNSAGTHRLSVQLGRQWYTIVS